jgi:DNA-binding MarR family transcriptional regulator
MNNFYITVSNGLLTKEHREQIGSAIWEFLWLLDKITKVDDKGFGYILGGKPIKLCELADQMGTSDMNVSRNLHKLEEAGYINILRTPYGMVIKVKKAQKRFNKNVRTKRETNENVGSPNGNVESPNENARYKEDNTVDSTEDSIAEASSAKEFNHEEELVKLRDNPRKDIKIIALYWKKKNWVFENRAQFNAAFKRELRAAKNLIGYSGEQIAKAINYCMKEYPDIWTLETCGKRITDLINKKP